MHITWGCAQWRFWNTFASNTFLSCKRLHTNVSSDEGFEKRKPNLTPMFIIKKFHLKDEKTLTKRHLNHYNSISNPIICIQVDIERVAYCNNQLLHKIKYSIINFETPYWVWQVLHLKVCVCCGLVYVMYEMWACLMGLSRIFNPCPFAKIFSIML